MTHEPSAEIVYREAVRERAAAHAAWVYIHSRVGWDTEKIKRWNAFLAAHTNVDRLYGRLLEAQQLDIKEAERAAQAVLDSNLDIEMGLAKLEAPS